MGGPLGKTKKVDARGVADIANELGAFTVVRAASHEAAAKMFENHPHFAIFPGERVEIMPVLPIPGWLTISAISTHGISGRQRVR